MSEPHTEPGSQMSSTSPGAPETDKGASFRANVEQFGDRAARLCQMLRAGRISSESCFRALTQLWLQVARSRWVSEAAEQNERQADAGGKQESDIL